MRISSLKQFVKLRQELTEERTTIESRLRDINEALGELPPPISARRETTDSPSTTPPRRGRRSASGGQSLREHVIAVLQGGPKTKEEVLSAVQSRGYKFSTNNPLNSLGVILYGRNPKFKRVDGVFSLSGDARAASIGVRRAGRRTMSPVSRARIAAAQRARWAKQRGGEADSLKAPSNDGTTKRKMSAAARKAMAQAARSRWAVAKAAGKSRL